MTAGLPNTSNRLPVLAAEINQSHVLAMQHSGRAVQHALRCGDLLIEAKAKIPHGQWLPWLRQNVDFSERSVQAYMRVAVRLGRNPQRVADLSLRDAMREVPRPAAMGFAPRSMLNLPTCCRAFAPTAPTVRPIRKIGRWTTQRLVPTASGKSTACFTAMAFAWKTIASRVMPRRTEGGSGVAMTARERLPIVAYARRLHSSAIRCATSPASRAIRTAGSPRSSSVIRRPVRTRTRRARTRR